MRMLFATLLLMLAVVVSVGGQTNGGSKTSDEVSLKVETSKQTYAIGEEINFSITFQNRGEEKFLSGGFALGRKRVWQSLECGLVDENQREIRLDLYFGVTVVAGRLDPFAQHLKRDESYTLNVTKKDYLFIDSNAEGVNKYPKYLPDGSYKLQCTYKPKPWREAKTLAVWEGDEFIQLWERHPESLPKLWDGSAVSNVYTFRVSKPK